VVKPGLKGEAIPLAFDQLRDVGHGRLVPPRGPPLDSPVRHLLA
jgi:hypothetical protein